MTKSEKISTFSVATALKRWFARVGPKKARSTSCRDCMSDLYKLYPNVVQIKDSSFGVAWSVLRRQYLQACGMKVVSRKKKICRPSRHGNSTRLKQVQSSSKEIRPEIRTVDLSSDQLIVAKEFIQTVGGLNKAKQILSALIDLQVRTGGVGCSV